MLSLFSARSNHPLADARELQRVVAELPLDNAFKAADEVLGWLEALPGAVDLRGDQLFEIVRTLDEAAQPHIRRLARDYLTAPRLSRSEERRLWSMNAEFWSGLANCYESCLTRIQGDGKEERKAAEQLRARLPLLHARLLCALGNLFKWREFRYGPIPGDLRQRAGRVYLVAEQAGHAVKTLQLYPQQPGVTSATQEYLRFLLLNSSSLDSLLPLEIELADRLITHFSGAFAFSAQPVPDSVYWVNAASDQPPRRMAKLPTELVPTLRFYAPGSAVRELSSLLHAVERGDVPTDLNLGGAYAARELLPVVRHLGLYWAAHPPIRSHRRHSVKSRLAVLHGFDDACAVAAFGNRDRGGESWVVENVSLGGFGAVLEGEPAGWLRVGTLLAMQPDGGDNWVLGIIRRFVREADDRAQVGVQTVARTATLLELMPRSGRMIASQPIQAVSLDVGCAEGEVHLALPSATFDLREALEGMLGGARTLLRPLELLETGSDFEIGRYQRERA